MYIKKKGTNKPIEVTIDRGPNEQGVFRNDLYVNYDSVFTYGDNDATMKFDSPHIRDYDVCTADGQTVCSLENMTRSMMYLALADRVNQNINRQVEALSTFAEAHKNSTILVPSMLHEGQALGVINPTLEQLGEMAAKYSLFDYNIRANESINFDDRFAGLFSQIAETEYALANTQSIGGLTLIQGDNLLPINHLANDYNVELQNVVIADVDSGYITVYADEWVCCALEVQHELGNASSYYGNEGEEYYFTMEFYGKADMVEKLQELEQALDQIFGYSQTQESPDEPDKPDDHDDHDDYGPKGPGEE